MHTFDIRVTAKDADVALRRFLFRNLGIGGLFAAIALIALVAADLFQGKLGVGSIIALTLLSILTLVYLNIFTSRRKQFQEQLKQLGESSISYSFDDSGWSIKSAMGSSTLKWEMLQKLWVDADLVLIFYSQNHYTTLPTTQIPIEALELLITQTIRMNRTVIDNRNK